MIIARLLTPAELGVYAVTMALLAFAATVRDMGAGQYLLQEKELNTDRIRAVWSVQLTVGIALALVVLMARSPVAGFYGDPQMREIMTVLSVNYVVNPLGSVTYAWLMREMRYDALAIIRFSATLSGASLSVLLAARGHGAISLAWGSLCSTTVNAAASTFFRPRDYPWLPGLREVPRVLSFGSRMTSSTIISTISTTAPDFLIGKMQGLGAVGYFSRATGLVGMFNRLVTDAVSTVALSLFAKLSRESYDSSSLFLRAVSYISALSWAFCLAIVFLAHSIIHALYGAQWEQSVDLARLLALAGGVAAVIPVCSAALLGSGQVVTLLKATAISALTSVILVALAASSGLLIVGLAVLISSFANATTWLVVTRRVVIFKWSALARALAPSAIVALLSALGPGMILFLLGPRPEHHLVALGLGLPLAATGFLLGLKLSRHPLLSELERLVPSLRPSDRKSGQPATREDRPR